MADHHLWGVTRFDTGWWTGKALSAQCAHWAPPPEGEARRRAFRRAGACPRRPRWFSLRTQPSSPAPKPSPSGEGGSPQARRMRGGVPPLTIRDCYPGGNPTPLEVHPVRYGVVGGKALSAQCAHWAPPPEGEARRHAFRRAGGMPPPTTWVYIARPWLHRAKAFPLGGRWLAAGETDEGHNAESTTSAEKPTPTPHQSKIKDFCQLPRGGSLFSVPRIPLPYLF